LAVSPDGRYAAFRSVHPIYYTDSNLINLVRIHDNGTLEYLHGKEVEVDYYIGGLAFAPLPANAARDWALYE
jgi:hypothetical protein